VCCSFDVVVDLACGVAYCTRSYVEPGGPIEALSFAADRFLPAALG
jgi:hypothetical protein